MTTRTFNVYTAGAGLDRNGTTDVLALTVHIDHARLDEHHEHTLRTWTLIPRTISTEHGAALRPFPLDSRTTLMTTHDRYVLEYNGSELEPGFDGHFTRSWTILPLLRSPTGRTYTNIPANLDLDSTDDFDGAWGSLTAVPAGFADNVDDDTTYTAGAGLDLTGTVFSVDGSTITPDWTNITNIPANLDLDSTDDFDGAWGSLTAVPAGFADNVDDDTTYSAGAGLDLTGTVFSVDGSSITPDWTNITNIPAGFADDIDNDTQLTDAQVATAVNNEFPNLDTDATDDFDGAWGSLTAVPAGFADNVDDNTTNDRLEINGSDLELEDSDGNILSVSLGAIAAATDTDDQDLQNFQVNGTNLEISIQDGNTVSVPLADIAAGTDTNTTYTAGAGLDLTGTEFSVDGSIDHPRLGEHHEHTCRLR